MLFDQLAKRLFPCPELLEALLAIACPRLADVLQVRQATRLKELPTPNLLSLVPDAMFEIPLSKQASSLGHSLPQNLFAGPAFLLIEATTRPSPQVLSQVELYFAQARLAYHEAKKKLGPCFALVFSLSASRSTDLELLARWHALDPPFGCASVARLLLVECRRTEHRKQAWERSPVLGFAMEAAVAVQRGREVVVRLMEAKGDRFMEARVGHEAAGEAGCLSAAETVLQFLVRMEASGTPEAKAWARRVRDWWLELGRRHGANMEAIMREAKTVYDYLIEDGIQQGIQQGIRQGLEQGRALSLRQAVYEVLEERFGSVPPLVREYVEAISDLGRLSSLHRRALKVDRPEDLLNGVA